MPKSLQAWLKIIEGQHHTEVDLGLERSGKVFQRLFPDCTSPDQWPITTITVAGTNGKGSTVACLESLAIAANLEVVSFTSPHLINYRERIRFQSEWLSEQQHIESLSAIHEAAKDIPLTYFEYNTLSVLYWAYKLKPDLLLLEVGLGGRLDAVNLVAADIAIITTVDYDHQDFLGDSLEEIATEKLGVVHNNTSLILADDTVPQTCLIDLKAKDIFKNANDFKLLDDDSWQWPDKNLGPFPIDTDLRPLTNIGAALAAFSILYSDLLNERLVVEAINSIKISGRFQKLLDSPQVYLDVAHNPQAIKNLVKRSELQTNKVHLVLGMLRDKNIVECLDLLSDVVSNWYICDINLPRGCSAQEIKELMQQSAISLTGVTCYSSVIKAYEAAYRVAEADSGLIIVLGSFHTVGPVLELVNNDVK